MHEAQEYVTVLSAKLGEKLRPGCLKLVKECINVVTYLHSTFSRCNKSKIFFFKKTALKKSKCGKLINANK